MIHSEGFEIRPAVLQESHVNLLLNAIKEHCRAQDAQAGLRDVAETIAEVRELQRSAPLAELATEVLGAPATCVRTILFDKTAEANWKVAWHQDLTIRVKERREVDGFGPWSRKDGIDHVQPPATVLARMITLRLHLDDCSAENGALRVLPQTHSLGRLSPQEIQELRARIPEITCEVPPGGVLLMRPLLLHASSVAVSPRHRRVLHFEYACDPLPGGLEWYEGNGKL